MGLLSITAINAFTYAFCLIMKMTSAATFSTHPPNLPPTHPANLPPGTGGVSSGIVSTHPAQLPTLPPDSMFEKAGTAVQALFELFKSEIKWREGIANRLPELENQLFNIEQKAGKLEEALKQANLTNNSTVSALHELKEEIDMVKSNVSFIANDAVDTKQQFQNETKDMIKRVEDLESNVNKQDNNTSKASELLMDRELALEKNLTELSLNVSSELSVLRDKTKKLEDTLNNPSATLNLIGEDFFNDTIQKLTDMVNSSTRDLRKLLIGELKNIYHITTRHGVTLVEYEKDLKNLTDLINNDLETEIQEMKSNCKTGLDSLQALQNESIGSIQKEVDKLKMAGKSQFDNLTRIISDNDIRYFENLAVTDQNVQNVVTEMRELAKNTTEIEQQLKQKHDELNRLGKTLENGMKVMNATTETSLSEIRDQLTGITDRNILLEKQHNDSINSLQMELDSKDKTIKNLQSNFSSELRKVLEASQQNISSVEETLNKKIMLLSGKSNSSELEKEIKELELKTDLKAANLSQQLMDFNVICHEGLSRVDSMVKFLATSQQNSSSLLSQRMDVLNGSLNSVNNYHNQAFKTLKQIIRLNVTGLDTKLGIETVKLGELDYTMKGIEKNVSDLLRNVERLQSDKTGDITGLKEEISKNITATKHEFQDFIAKMIATENSNIQNFLQGLQKLDAKINDLSLNYSDALHLAHANSLKDKIAMTTCSNTKAYDGGYPILFPNTKTKYGIDNMADFATSGKFSAQSPGLYLITAQIMSYSKGAEYEIMKNGGEIVRVQVTPYEDTDAHNYHTGTGTAVVDLDINDKLWVQVRQTVSSMYVYGAESCLTIVKLV